MGDFKLRVMGAVHELYERLRIERLAALLGG